MRTIRKGPEPKSLLEYRKAADAHYDGYQAKQDVREQLVAEQRALCCYCQSRIRARQCPQKQLSLASRNEVMLGSSRRS